MHFFREASELAACGFQVFPVQPVGDDGQLRKHATDDLAALSVWDKRTPLWDVALTLGETSDVLAVHVSHIGFDELHTLSLHGLNVPQCPVSQSSDGEAVLWFRNLSGFAGRRVIGIGLTALGEGEIWRAPPSHDRHGGRWVWVTAPWDVKPPVLPDWLVARIVPHRRPARDFRKYATIRRPA